MKCLKCSQDAVIIGQHGGLCKTHFITYFENKVIKTINKYKLISREDKVCIAASGGKDSMTAIYLVKKYFNLKKLNPQNLFVLTVDEGIKGYRDINIKNLEKFCKKHDVKLIKASFKKEFGTSIDKAHLKINNQKPCNICGTWRRYILNKESRKYKATKLVTGHNLDDEAQSTLMNIFKANNDLLARLGPISGTQDHKLFVQRIKPLYLCLEKETRLYTYLKNFPIIYSECPYSQTSYRSDMKTMLNNFEYQYPGTKQGIVKSLLALLPLLGQKKEVSSIKLCQICGEPANQPICKACKQIDNLK
jgi:tRNA-5-methyluridine54 2-sulfurtransferase